MSNDSSQRHRRSISCEALWYSKKQMKNRDRWFLCTKSGLSSVGTPSSSHHVGISLTKAWSVLGRKVQLQDARSPIHEFRCLIEPAHEILESCSLIDSEKKGKPFLEVGLVKE